MTVRLASLPAAGKPPIAWRRAALGLLASTGAALWLASWPSLFARDGLVGDGCRLGYRDPVTGRPTSASKRIARCASPRKARP